MSESLLDAASKALPWVMSALTIWTMYLAGNKARLAWQIGLGNQALWAIFIVTTHQWGLAPMCAAITFVYARNLLKWSAP